MKWCIHVLIYRDRKQNCVIYLWCHLLLTAIFFLNRFDPNEPITHGVETLNHCEITVDVAVAEADSWTLQTEEGAHAKMSGEVSHYGVYIRRQIQIVVFCKDCNDIHVWLLMKLV